jgi:hypothetical protein
VIDPWLEEEANRLASAWTGMEYVPRGERLRLSADQAEREVERIVSEHAGEHGKAGEAMFR